MKKTDTLKKILGILAPDDTSEVFKAFDEEANKLKESLKEKIQVKTLEGVNVQLDRFRRSIDINPLIEKVGKIEEDIDQRIKEVNSQLEENSSQLKEIFSQDKEAASKNLTVGISGVTDNITKLKTELADLTKKRDVEVAGLKSTLEDLKKLEGKFNTKIENLNKTIETSKSDSVKSKKELQDEIKKFNKEIEDLRTEFNSRIGSLGGGSMNRQVLIGGVDPLTKYTDINLKAGTGTTITYATNNTTKRVDVTITATGSGSGITRSITSISVDTTASDTAGIDYVYLASGTTTLTLPTAVSNTNLYTIKNVGSGIVTIATTSAQTIDGSSTIVLPVQYTSVDIISDNSNWSVT